MFAIAPRRQQLPPRPATPPPLPRDTYDATTPPTLPHNHYSLPFFSLTIKMRTLISIDKMRPRNKMKPFCKFLILLL